MYSISLSFFKYHANSPAKYFQLNVLSLKFAIGYNGYIGKVASRLSLTFKQRGELSCSLLLI